MTDKKKKKLTAAEKAQKKIDAANKYKITDKGWWYNTDEGRPHLLQGVTEFYRPLSSYKKKKKKHGGRVNHFRDNRQYD